MNVRHAALAVFLVLPLDAAASPPRDIASIPTTVSIEEVALPDKQHGLKLLVYALGPDVPAASRSLVSDAFLDLRAFAGIVEAGGGHELRITLRELRKERDDVSAPDHRRPLAVTLDATWAWTLPGGEVLEGDERIFRVRTLSDVAQRADLRGVVGDAVTELGQRAFSSLYKTKHSTDIDAAPRTDGAR